MNILLSAAENRLDGPVDPRFGRAQYFIKINTDSNEWEALPNPGINLSGGAGVAAAQFAIDQKVDAVVSGDFGPNAAGAFKAAGMPLYLYNKTEPSVAEAVSAFKLGKLGKF